MEGSHHGTSLEVRRITPFLVSRLTRHDLLEASDSELSRAIWFWCRRPKLMFHDSVALMIVALCIVISLSIALVHWPGTSMPERVAEVMIVLLEVAVEIYAIGHRLKFPIFGHSRLGELSSGTYALKTLHRRIRARFRTYGFPFGQVRAFDFEGSSFSFYDFELRGLCSIRILVSNARNEPPLWRGSGAQRNTTRVRAQFRHRGLQAEPVQSKPELDSQINHLPEMTSVCGSTSIWLGKIRHDQRRLSRN
jgi:hypothetical protein